DYYCQVWDVSNAHDVF
nr:immunoglobulin light chain junction region [Macaca mulatta]MOY06711.1 immunoglobulin light chain junction region [Macaca mulatta]MOY06995.1 immunoglobulin light chain junction region [Macaca mulatta]MOY07557.1 immunoglobulin light chain junction region [Macaca mulatta]MOY09023.1 immunoglobulin light chain junction region [Macaca mulatta]